METKTNYPKWEYREVLSDEVGCLFVYKDGARLYPKDSQALRDFIVNFNPALMPKIVCLCGSTKFKREYADANYVESLKGNIVLSVGVFHHSAIYKNCLTKADKDDLDVLHLRKIDLADEVFIINVGGYMGDSTKSELAYAYCNNKKVRFLETRNSKVVVLSVTGNWELIEPDRLFDLAGVRLSQYGHIPAAVAASHLWWLDNNYDVSPRRVKLVWYDCP